MFLIPRLFEMGEQGMSGYQQILSGGITEIASETVKRTVTIAVSYSSNSLAMIAIAIAGHLLWREAKGFLDEKKIRIGKTGIDVSVCILVLDTLLTQNIWYGQLATLRGILTSVFFFLLAGYVLYPAFLLAKRDREVRTFLLLLLAAIFAVSPFLLVSPFGPRGMFLSYVIFAMAILYLFDRKLKKEDIPKPLIKKLKTISCTAMIGMVVIISLIFVNAKMLTDRRDAYIYEQLENGETELDFFEIPYSYFWAGDNCWFFEKYLEKCGYENITFHKMDVYDWTNKHT